MAAALEGADISLDCSLCPSPCLRRTDNVGEISRAAPGTHNACTGFFSPENSPPTLKRERERLAAKRKDFFFRFFRGRRGFFWAMLGEERAFVLDSYFLKDQEGALLNFQGQRV